MESFAEIHAATLNENPSAAVASPVDRRLILQMSVSTPAPFPRTSGQHDEVQAVEAENGKGLGNRDDKARIGVLLVHGIGEQRPGDALLGMGEPMITWLQRWLDGVGARWEAQGLDSATLDLWLRTVLHCDKSSLPGEENAALARIGQTEPPSLELAAHAFGPMSRESLQKWDLLLPLLRPTTSRKSDRALDPHQIKATAEREALAFLVARAQVTHATLQQTQGTPCHARLRIDTLDPEGNHKEEDWLFAEAHWAQDFASPPTGRVALWTAFVCPYAVATVFLDQLTLTWSAVGGSRLDLPRPTALFRLLLLVALFPALPLVTLVLQLALGTVTVLATLPFESLRRKLRIVQWALSAVIGDSFAFLKSPMNRASVIASITRRIDWLASRCQNLIIVAHSQGAHVVLETLRVRLPDQLRLLVSVGSGVGRLNALSASHTRAGDFLRVSIGLEALCCLLLWDAYRLLREGSHWWLGMTVLGMLFYTVLFASLGSDVESNLHPGWTSLLRLRKIHWLDYFTPYDPVPAEVLAGQTLARQEVSNFGSVLFDHTGYWANHDQFVPSLTHAIACAGESHLGISRLGRLAGASLEFAARWRPCRVAWLKMGWWLATLSWVAVGLLRAEELGGALARVQGEIRRLTAEGDGVWGAWLGGLSRSLGSSLLVLAWVGTCALVYMLWAMWERRDATWFVAWRGPYAHDGFVFLLHFFAWLYLAGLASMLAFSTLVCVNRPRSVWYFVPTMTLFVLVLAAELSMTQMRVWRDVLERRDQRPVPIEEAVGLSGASAEEVRGHCAPVKRVCNAMAFDTAMYDDAGLFDAEDVLKLKQTRDAARGKPHERPLKAQP